MPTKEEILQALQEELEQCERAGKTERARAIKEQIAALRGDKKPARSKHDAAEKRG